ncbi:MAG: glycosyltransferase family 4 protein [Candidatus Omnitrophota bacterium]
MRILIVHPGIYVYGGAELLIVKLLNYLTARGIKNALLTNSVIPEVKKDLTGTEILIFEKKSFNSFQLGEALSLHKGISRVLKEFDLINIHNYPAELAVFPYHKPVVWMCNEPAEVSLGLKNEASLIKRLAIKTILLFDKYVVKNHVKTAVVADNFNFDRFRRLYGFDPEIINYGIEYDFFSQGDKKKVRKDYNLNDRFVVLQSGMLTPMKNQLESVQTVEKLRDKIPNIKLILAGWGDRAYIEKIKSYIKEKDLTAAVIITGHLGRESLRDFYHGCDIVLQPIKPQGGWLAPFEALCAKRIIIVSPEMTASDIIKQEDIGVVTDNFSEAVLDIYNNRDKYRILGERGAEWVKENLKWDKFCERMLRCFIRITERSKE